MEAVYKADVCDQSVSELVQVRDKILLEFGSVAQRFHLATDLVEDGVHMVSSMPDFRSNQDYIHFLA